MVALALQCIPQTWRIKGENSLSSQDGKLFRYKSTVLNKPEWIHLILCMTLLFPFYTMFMCRIAPVFNSTVCPMEKRNTRNSSNSFDKVLLPPLFFSRCRNWWSSVECVTKPQKRTEPKEEKRKKTEQGGGGYSNHARLSSKETLCRALTSAPLQWAPCPCHPQS